MEKILLATQNQGKVREFRKLLAPLGLTIVTPADLAETIEVIEDQNTFAGNAFKKAMTFFQLTGFPTIADDSGLAVDYIDGRPGVFSARYSGEQATDASNNAKLLFELDGGPYGGAHSAVHFCNCLCPQCGLPPNCGRPYGWFNFAGLSRSKWFWI